MLSVATQSQDMTKVDTIRRHIDDNVETLLQHRFFANCRNGSITRTQLVELIKQLYCFSVYFERLLARRLATYTSDRDPEIVRLARAHLREEVGHSELFSKALIDNGMSVSDIQNIAPKAFTKALFGYLLATVDYENEFVGHIAIIQVMETIGSHFFDSALKVLQQFDMRSAAFDEHAEDDKEHANLGIEQCAYFSDKTMADSHRVIDDIFKLMGFALDEWMGLAPRSTSFSAV